MKEVFSLNMLNILSANYNAEDNSFLYYLHEKNCFNEVAFSELRDCISYLCRTHPTEQTVSSQIVFIYGQVLRHIIYHFDPKDTSQISDLPCDYNEKLEFLECEITRYFNANSHLSG